LSSPTRRSSDLVEQRQAKFPASGEINRKLQRPADVLQQIRARYEPGARQISTLDGLSIEFDDWRFNLRSSNTEPVVRLNVESRGDRGLMQAKTAELLEQIAAFDQAPVSA